MNLRFNQYKKYISIGIIAFLVIAASMLFYFALFHWSSLKAGFQNISRVLAPILYGIAIAFLLTPVAKFIEVFVIETMRHGMKIDLKKRGERIIRWISVIVALLLFVLLIYGLLAMVLPDLIRTVINLVNNFPNYVQTVMDWAQNDIGKRFINKDMMETMNRYIAMAQDYLTNNVIPQLQGMLVNLTSGVFDLIIFFKNFFVGCLVSIYIMADRNYFAAGAKMVTYAVFSMRWANFFIRSMRYAGHTFVGFISGKIIDSAIIGVICYCACSIMDMPYSLLISVVIGVTNVIPFFGPFVGAVPCLLLILLVDPLKCLYFLIFVIILQQFDGNILGPKILGDSTGISSLMVIVAVIVGGGFFGLFGMLVGVPTFAVIYNGLVWLTRRSLRKRQLPAQDDDYLEIDRLDAATHKPIPYDPEAAVAPSQVKPRRKSAISKGFMIIWNGIILILSSLVRIVVMCLRYVINTIRVWFLRLFRAIFKKD